MARAPSARTIARLMTIGRDNLSKSETVTIAAIERGTPSLVEAREIIAGFQAMVRKKSLIDLDPWLDRGSTKPRRVFRQWHDKRSRRRRRGNHVGMVKRSNGRQITKLKLVKRAR